VVDEVRNPDRVITTGARPRLIPFLKLRGGGSGGMTKVSPAGLRKKLKSPLLTKVEVRCGLFPEGSREQKTSLHEKTREDNTS